MPQYLMNPGLHLRACSELSQACQSLAALRCASPGDSCAFGLSCQTQFRQEDHAQCITHTSRSTFPTAATSNHRHGLGKPHTWKPWDEAALAADLPLIWRAGTSGASYRAERLRDGVKSDQSHLKDTIRRPSTLERCRWERWHQSGRLRCTSRHEGEGVVTDMRKLLEDESSNAIKAATELVTAIDQRGRAALLCALYSSASDHSTADLLFKEADKNADGVLDKEEFANYLEAQEMLSSRPLTVYQIFNLGIRAAVGMLGFGFVDNAVMIIAGDAIENSLGAMFGLTTLTSAGLGNAVSDFLGTAFSGYIDGFCTPLMPELKVSTLQMNSKEAWWAETVGSSLGITLGCLLGLIPLVFIGEKASGAKALGPKPSPPGPRQTAVSHRMERLRSNRLKRSNRMDKPLGSSPSHELRWCSASVALGSGCGRPFTFDCVESATDLGTRIRCVSCHWDLAETLLVLAMAAIVAFKRLQTQHGRRKERKTLQHI